MKIERIELFRYHLALRRPVKIRMYVNHGHAGLLVCMTDSRGVKGWGDISPLMGLNRESVTEAESNLKATAEHLRGYSLPDDLTVLDALDALLAKTLPSVRCGCEMAVLNLLAEARGVPMYRLWSDRELPRININTLLAGTTDEVVRDAEALRGTSCTCAKIKVGALPLDHDIERVLRVGATLGPGIRIRLDANRAWKSYEAVQFALAVRHLPIEYIEEPVDLPLNIPAFHADTGMAVALDETLTDTPHSTWQKFTGVKAIVVKPTVLGGFRKVARLAEEARRTQLEVVTSAVYESGVGIMALANAAAVWGGPEVPAGLDTYRSIDWDVLTPRLPYENGALALNELTMRHHEVDRGTLLSV